MRETLALCSQAHLTYQYWCDANNAGCAKQWPKCQNNTPKYVPSQCNKIKKTNKNKQTKTCSRNWKKLGLNPQLSWLTTVLSTWFWQECTTANESCSPSSLYTNANKSRYPSAINIFEFPDDVRLISLKSRFDACLECEVTVLSKLNSKKTCSQKDLIFKNKSFPHLDSTPRPPECKSVELPIELYDCGFQWTFFQFFVLKWL